MLGNGSDNEANIGRIQRMSNAAGAFERREERVANSRTVRQIE